jgi:hypothetical protein
MRKNKLAGRMSVIGGNSDLGEKIEQVRLGVQHLFFKIQQPQGICDIAWQIHDFR